ncbi:DnaD domain protein [Streptococcus uberis]|nr:DnaD domain protein [Streptococcus uberis]
MDRKLLEEAYYLASLNEANTLGYVVAILNKWEELNIRTYAEFEEHEYQHVKGNDESPF